MFNKILIANRGEIACRVAATAKRLGVAQRRRLFRRGRATRSTSPSATKRCTSADRLRRESYLRIERIIDAARATGAQAIHPGYGFLSENEDFAHACDSGGHRLHRTAGRGHRRDGLEGGGQGADAMRPRCRWCRAITATTRTRSCCNAKRTRIGYPVLLKASAGGGGKGMRVVETQRGLRGGAGLVQARGGEQLRQRSRADRKVSDCGRATSKCRCSPTSTAAPSICSTATARCSGVTRKCWRKRPRRACPTKCKPRDGRSGGGRRARGELRRRGHGRVHHDAGRRVLLHGDEHAAAGRASGHGDGDGSRSGGMAAARRRGRTAAAHAASS